MPLQRSLQQFVQETRDACVADIGTQSFCADQRALLEATLAQLFESSAPGDWGQPLGLFYATYRVCGTQADEVALELARFVTFYIAAADLFDDVQDDDLRGKPHEHAGAAIATNSALTLLTLALDALGSACERESRVELRLRYLRLFNRVSLIAVAAQHQDLLGESGARSIRDVAAMHRGKTSSVALVCECAALAGGADPTTATQFYLLGEELAASVQIIDDVRDLVAKQQSVDLVTGKCTYPLACFHEAATPAQQEHLAVLRAQSPIDLGSVCTLLEQAGAFDRCASAVEEHRQRIHRILHEVTHSESPHATLIREIVDQLASVLYDPAPLPEYVPPVGAGDEAAPLRRKTVHIAEHFRTTMRPFGFLHAPKLVPWHLPFCLYVPQRDQIYISDVRGLPEETVPFHAQLLGISLEETIPLLVASEPFLLAHELTHAWRHQLGVLSDDAWHEEHIANRIALAYVERHYQESARAVRQVAQLLGQRYPDLQAQRHRARLVAASENTDGQSRDYQATMEESALIHAAMVRHFAADERPLESLVSRWLPAPVALAAE